MIRIDSIDDTRILRYKSLRYTPQSHLDDKVFVAEGFKVVNHLLNSDLEIESFFAEPKYYDYFHTNEKLAELKFENKLTASKNLMDGIVGYRLHNGIMAIGKQPELYKPEELNSPLIILNGIVDAENVGSIIRNCAAFGIDSLIYDKPTADPYMRRAVRVSMGAVFSMKLSFSDNLYSTIENLKDNGYKVFAAETGERTIDLNSALFPRHTAVVFGSEGKGISTEILEICDLIVQIPITDRVDSLNVSAATAVFLYTLSQNIQ